MAKGRTMMGESVDDRVAARAMGNSTTERMSSPVGTLDDLTRDDRDDSAGAVAITLDDVHFSYPDGTHVIDGLSLNVRVGETVGIVGPSGCGKSTLLSLISGLAAPERGVAGCRDDGSGRHPLTMVFQNDTLMPWATAAENVRMFARFRSNGLRRGRLGRLVGRGPNPEALSALDERVEELLNLAHLSANAGSYPRQLSGGMRRRLAFLTGIAPNPQILLLDEPFSAVDEPTRVGIHQDVHRIQRLMHTTTVLVTHDLAEAATLCDRVVILSNRPAVIAHEHVVPFGEDRNMLELRESPEFLELYGALWRDLSEQMAAGPGGSASPTGRGEA